MKKLSKKSLRQDHKLMLQVFDIQNRIEKVCKELTKEFGFDIRRIFEDIKRSEVQTELEGWHHVQPAAVLSESALRKVRFAHD